MGLFSRTLSRLDEMKKTLGRDPGSRQFLALADEYRRQGQVREAIGTLENGLSQNPGSVAGHVALGRLLQQTGELDGALASFGAALKLDPQNLVAIRQTADVHMSRGDKVEAIKKLKLFRGLSPGDRDVNDLIRQLDLELAAAGSSRPPSVRPDVAMPPPPAPELRTGSGAVQRATAPSPQPPAEAPVPSSPAPPVPAEPVSTPIAVVEAAETPLAPEAAPFEEAMAPAAAEGRAFLGELSAAAPAEPEPPVETKPLPVPEAALAPEPVAEAASPREALPEPSAARDVDEAPFPSVPVPAGVPAVTETLAELLRSQGHLGEASEAYREVARVEPDRERAERLRGIADELSAVRGTTPRGRLEAWVEPFALRRADRDAGLASAVQETVARLEPCAALVTDTEGVPVVSAGPRSEAESMESLAAELTAFWKNVRRSRAELGEGDLDSLVLKGSTGTTAVKAITPAYALFLKAGPGVPAGRIRFEAARAAEQLRPALL